jgi:hypothetical protein
MSEQVVCQTEYVDQEALVEALQDIGIPTEKIEVHETPAMVAGYEGRNSHHMGHVIVRSGSIGTYADIGFERTHEGKIQIHMDHMDQARGYGHKIHGNELKQSYSKCKLIRAANGLKHKFKVGKCTRVGRRVNVEIFVK